MCDEQVATHAHALNHAVRLLYVPHSYQILTGTKHTYHPWADQSSKDSGHILLETMPGYYIKRDSSFA